jgi:hypothetical protein
MLAIKPYGHKFAITCDGYIVAVVATRAAAVSLVAGGAS